MRVNPSIPFPSASPHERAMLDEVSRAIGDVAEQLPDSQSVTTVINNAITNHITEYHQDSDWQYLPVSNPEGAPGPSCVYQFDGGASSLDDRAGNASSFTANVSTPASPGWPIYGDVNRLRSLRFGNFGTGSHYLYGSSGDAFHAFAGAMTLEVLCSPSLANPIASTALLECGRVDAVNKPAEASLYGIWRATGYDNWFYHHENAGTFYNLWTEAQSAVAQMQLLTLTRDASGTGIKTYLNGTLRDSSTLAAAPAGGSSSRLQIGEVLGGAAQWEGHVASLRITGGYQFTAAQALAAYQQCRGIL